MLRTTLVLLVLIAAVPAAAEEMITVNKTPIREKPDLKAEVLGEIPANVKITPSERRDFWFRVTYKAGDKTVEGWVYQFDVDTLMGRSKGQLLAENKRLYDEVVELREKVKAQDAKLETVKAQLVEATAGREELRAALTVAQEQIKQLTEQIDLLKKKTP